MAESSRGPAGSLERALVLARAALAEAPAGLLTDFDGTLSPIVADPAAARLADGAAVALEMLTRRLAVVAVVTGRAPLDARRMVGVPGLLIAGNHGTEWLEPDVEAPTTSPDAERVRRGVRAALARLPEADGIAIEDKGLSATVHYRSARDPERTRRQITEALDGVGPEVELRAGRMSVEIRPRGLGDKGEAAVAIIDRFALRGVVVMGDDLTDLDMFAAVDEGRRAGRLRAAIIGVGGADAEVPARVAQAADEVLDTPAAAAEFLSQLAKA